jgi:hypothetical protein
MFVIIPPTEIGGKRFAVYSISKGARFLLPIPIPGQGGTDMTHPSFMMIFIATAIAVCLQAILAMPEPNLSGIPDQDAMPKH